MVTDVVRDRKKKKKKGKQNVHVDVCGSALIGDGYPVLIALILFLHFVCLLNFTFLLSLFLAYFQDA